ncbi:hypothetical protein P5673_026865 [Acropora cervicornis]|uniref:Uncharacterized protein n=1 Tax=Acropora cervicornis TaxID=6130 RepID=A0AAD9Q0K6_ACRCE|nr:hypothetical protein P5673_026865 [Acropora cervicornis]
MIVCSLPKSNRFYRELVPGPPCAKLRMERLFDRWKFGKRLGESVLFLGQQEKWLKQKECDMLLHAFYGFNGYFGKTPSNWEVVLTQIRKPDEIDAADPSSQLKILLNALCTHLRQKVLKTSLRRGTYY